ncbi:uncharacterized protein LOC114012624 [Falco peregrinus]|uniref:uncharacterized protein LOC114012624 n=1 Tax=Falco peregrinus TaxID=8954 RepID=UPI00247ADEF4|nr:uncharacterized protein LOC114012624 [Falco peregrinus]
MGCRQHWAVGQKRNYGSFLYLIGAEFAWHATKSSARPKIWFWEAHCPRAAVTKKFTEVNGKDGVYPKQMNHGFGYLVGETNWNGQQRIQLMNGRRTYEETKLCKAILWESQGSIYDDCIKCYSNLSSPGRARVQSPSVRGKPELRHSDLFSLEDVPGAHHSQHLRSALTLPAGCCQRSCGFRDPWMSLEEISPCTRAVCWIR